MRLIFMGTPDYACTILHAIYHAGYEVAAVVTQPDKPRGRGYTMMPPPVKEEAIAHGTPVLQPMTLRTPEIQEELRAFKADVIVVAAYGKILPQEVLSMPRFGCINMHASLLPRWRGAAPIQRAILAGDTETGVTAMQMDAGLDTGDMLGVAKTVIDEHDTFGTLHDRLAQLGADLMLETLRKLQSGTLTAVPQPEEGTTYAAKIEKEDSFLHWERPADVLACQIRALSPAPLAITTHRNKKLKCTAAHPVPGAADHPVNAIPGSVIFLEKDAFIVACGNGTQLAVTGVLPEGKRSMPAADFIRGRGIAVGDLLR